jgi:hypothetical protein
LKKAIILLALILIGAFLFTQKKPVSIKKELTLTKVSSPVSKDSPLPASKKIVHQNKKFIDKVEESFDGSWKKIKFKKGEQSSFLSKDSFQQQVLAKYPFLLEDLPKGVRIDQQSFNETPTNNIVIWKYSYNGVPYPGQKVFFLRKDDRSFGSLFQINNDVPLLLNFNNCKAMAESDALKIIQGLHNADLSNIKVTKKYFPDSGQTASLGYEFTYDLKKLNNSFLVAIDACKGNLIKGPVSILEH